MPVKPGATVCCSTDQPWSPPGCLRASRVTAAWQQAPTVPSPPHLHKAAVPPVVEVVAKGLGHVVGNVGAQLPELAAGGTREGDGKQGPAGSCDRQRKPCAGGHGRQLGWQEARRGGEHHQKEEHAPAVPPQWRSPGCRCPALTPCARPSPRAGRPAASQSGPSCSPASTACSAPWSARSEGAKGEAGQAGAGAGLSRHSPANVRQCADIMRRVNGSAASRTPPPPTSRSSSARPASAVRWLILRSRASACRCRSLQSSRAAISASLFPCAFQASTTRRRAATSSSRLQTCKRGARRG